MSCALECRQERRKASAAIWKSPMRLASCLFYAPEAVSLWDELELPVAFWPEAASFDDADEPFESVEGDDEPEPLPFDAF